VVLVVALVVLWVAAFAFWHGRRPNWSALPASATWVALVELAVSAALVSVVSMTRGPLMLGPPARRVLLALTVPALGAAALALLQVPGAEPSPHATFWSHALACEAGVGLAAVPLVVFLVSAQRGRTLASPGGVGAVAGAAAATWGHAILHWGCRWTDLGHLFVGHVVPVIPLAIGGALFSRWFHRARPTNETGRPRAE